MRVLSYLFAVSVMVGLSACDSVGVPGTGGAGGEAGETFGPGGFGGASEGGTSGGSEVGGTTSEGGSVATGGTVAEGGSVADGGTVSTGGVTSEGGAVAEGGVTAVGGSDVGGTTASGGTDVGGTTSTGGSTGTPVVVDLGEKLLGSEGDLMCGTVRITPEEWHAPCGTDLGVCIPGHTQCRYQLVDGVEQENLVCVASYGPFPRGNQCFTDLDCDGQYDDTTGLWINAFLVKAPGDSLITISNVEVNHVYPEQALETSLCRNATKTCITPERADQCLGGLRDNNCYYWHNSVGVYFDDFVPAANEQLVGTSCDDADATAKWTCTISAEGKAEVTCVSDVTENITHN